MWSECGARGRAIHPLPGGSGHRPAGNNDRPARSSLDWDEGKMRVTPDDAETQEARLELS